MKNTFLISKICSNLPPTSWSSNGNENLLNFNKNIDFQAYVFTDAPQIIGVEMNEEFCKLQNDTIRKYKMTDRIEVVNKKIEECKDLVESADVIVFNNALEFYVPDNVSIEIWCFLKEHIKPNALLVTRPHLKAIFKNLKSDLLVEEKWVEPCKVEDEDETHSIGVYKVR